MNLEDLKKTMEDISKRFPPKRGSDNPPFHPMPIKLLDEDETVFRMHWVGGSSLKHAASQILRIDAFPRCPSCKIECCHGHPRNGCELMDIFDVSES